MFVELIRNADVASGEIRPDSAAFTGERMLLDAINTWKGRKPSGNHVLGKDTEGVAGAKDNVGGFISGFRASRKQRFYVPRQ